MYSCITVPLKKLFALGNTRAGAAPKLRAASIVNRLYWSVMTTPAEDGDLVVAKWLSIVDRVQNSDTSIVVVRYFDETLWRIVCSLLTMLECKEASTGDNIFNMLNEQLTKRDLLCQFCIRRCSSDVRNRQGSKGPYQQSSTKHLVHGMCFTYHAHRCTESGQWASEHSVWCSMHANLTSTILSRIWFSVGKRQLPIENLTITRSIVQSLSNGWIELERTQAITGDEFANIMSPRLH